MISSYRYIKGLPILLMTCIAINAEPYEELTPNFNMLKSPVMIRKIAKATPATLDYTAYSNNPIRFDHQKFKPKKPDKKISLVDITFGGNLKNTVNSIEKTPLSEEEKKQPMAWTPLQNLLWSELKVDAIASIGSRIISEKWSDPDIFQPYQNIAAVYVHSEKNESQIWIAIEFSPWVRFFDKTVTDSDKNGLLDIYGMLNCATVDDETMTKVVNWIQTSYFERLLSYDEILDWGQVLASYWYPTLNTDIVDMSGQSQWPTKETEKGVVKKLKGTVVKSPTLVIKGNPHGKPLYNVFVVENVKKVKKALPVIAEDSTVNKVIDTAISENVRMNNLRFQNELKPFGDYATWYANKEPIQKAIRAKIDKLPANQMAVPGGDNWLFFRKTFDYILAGDLGKQSEDKNPLTHLVAFKNYLADNNINLLFIAVPTKAEIYSHKLGLESANDNNRIINPYGRKILFDLQKAGIEVIDLMPRFLMAKDEDSAHVEPVYQKHDTHWTNRGLQITATLIADRIKQYGWYNEKSLKKVSYIIVDTSFERLGDIVERLPEREKGKYKAATLKAQQVRNSDGTLHKGKRQAPILVIGDSFTGVFELIDCKSAGIGSHIAAKTGLPVDIIPSWGGGPLIRNKMIRMRKKDMSTKRLVVYIMVSRDLYDYSQGWEELKTE